MINTNVATSSISNFLKKTIKCIAFCAACGSCLINHEVKASDCGNKCTKCDDKPKAKVEDESNKSEPKVEKTDADAKNAVEAAAPAADSDTAKAAAPAA